MGSISSGKGFQPVQASPGAGGKAAGTYRFQSPVGLFWIRARDDGRYVLGIDDAILEIHNSSASAAGVVHTHETGWDAWDGLRGMADIPADPGEWEKV